MPIPPVPPPPPPNFPPNLPDPPERRKRRGGPAELKPVEPRGRLPGEPDLAALRAAAEAELAQREAFLEVQEGVWQEGGIVPADYIPAATADRLRRVAAEKARRRMEALRLYEPLLLQHAFHISSSQIRLLRGSNRGGKTLPAAVEVARAVTGQDPHGKYPKENGRAFIIGKDLSHIGDVQWRKLGRPGGLKMIRDKVTGHWRAFRPLSHEDQDRIDEARSAPPLIPKRLIKEIAWENKKEQIPSIVRLHNGWELNFFSSLGKPPQGSDVDLVWMDEEIVDPEWCPEMLMRIADRKGTLIWSATPQAGTDQLYDLHERAEEERGKPKPDVEEFVILLADNPHIGADEKRKMAANLDPEQQRVRIGGHFALTSFTVYPEFSMLIHGMDAFDVPHEWARYAVVDPGHQVCAVLFAAVPPANDRVYLFDELYLRECDAVKFGEHMAARCQGRVWQTFLIDPNMAIYTEVGRGKTVGEQYTDELAKRGCGSVETGARFQLGCDDVEAGLLAVHGWLRPSPDGSPRLKVLKGCLPNFEFEIKRYHKKRVNGYVVDKPDQRKHTHLMDCLRYLALSNPRYVKPQVKKAPIGAAVKAYRAKLERIKRKNGGSYVRLGPGQAKVG